jgi:hypothetical protein
VEVAINRVIAHQLLSNDGGSVIEIDKKVVKAKVVECGL